MSIYEKIVVIGYGKIAAKVIEYVFECQKKYGYSIEYIEHETGMFGAGQKICAELGVDYHKFTDKKELTDYLRNLTIKCLIISAGNNYLFPEALTEDPQYTIINFHNALLPKFPGRNAPSWAIFENEKETGITWHYVTKQVDGGDIIIQKSCTIEPNIRAYELAEELMQLAYEGFCEKFREVIENRVIVIKQKAGEKRKLYKSTDNPGNCGFNIEDSPEYIYRLLRAVDYGKYNIFPPVTTRYKEKIIKIIRYRKIPLDKARKKQGRIYLPLDDGSLLSLAWVEIC